MISWSWVAIDWRSAVVSGVNNRSIFIQQVYRVWLLPGQQQVGYSYWVASHAQRCSLLLQKFCGLCVCLCVSLSITMSCVKTAELIEMTFAVWTQVGPRNHVLGVGPDPPGKGAILQCALLSKIFDHLLLYNYRLLCAHVEQSIGCMCVCLWG